MNYNKQKNKEAQHLPSNSQVGGEAYSEARSDGERRTSLELLSPENAAFTADPLEAFQPVYKHTKQFPHYSLICPPPFQCM